MSGGELDLAGRAGFPASRTVLEGVGKSAADLRRAAAMAAAGTPLAWVSLESADEARELADAVRVTASRHVARVDVVVRLNPRVRPDTHPGLAVGAAESKFGVFDEELPGLVEAGGGPDGPLRWRGLHLHVGSQLGVIDAWRSAIRVGIALLGLQRAGLPDFDTLDLGGGFPVRAGGEPVPSPADFARAAGAVLDDAPPTARPARLAIEPGRTLVARSGWLVSQVLHVRDRPSRQVILDAGMTELIRPALYGARHPIVALTSLGRPVDGGQEAIGGEASIDDGGPGGSAPAAPGEAPEAAEVHGPVCESTDRIGLAALPPLRRGDLVAIGLAGAYASAMSSRYNGRPAPVELAWDGRRVRVLRRRGTSRSLP